MKKRNHASKMALLAVFASGIFVGSNVTYAENNTSSSTATPVVEVKPIDDAGTGSSSSSSSGTGAAVTPDPVVPAKPINNGTDADNTATSPVSPTSPVADNTTANPVTPDPAASTATSGSSSATTDPATPTKPAKSVASKTDSSSTTSSKKDQATPATSATGSSQAAKPTVPDPATPAPATTTVTRAVVSPTAPVTTESGVQIIGTDGGNVIVADGNGGSRTVAPEEVGAKKNSDGTISVKTKENKLETLPETGTAESLAVSAVGVLTLVGGLYLKKRATEE